MPKHPPKPKLTDSERYKRFLDAAKAVGASDDPEDFDRAFMAVARSALEGDQASRLPRLRRSPKV